MTVPWTTTYIRGMTESPTLSPAGFIALLQRLHPDLIRQGQRGTCFHVYRLLAEVFPGAEAYYDQQHVITKIGERFYDITGEVTPTPEYARMKDNPESYNRAHLWEAGVVGSDVAEMLASELVDVLVPLEFREEAMPKFATLIRPFLLRNLRFTH